MLFSAHAADDAARVAGRIASGKRGHVVDYRHVIHALRRKPMALLNLVYRERSSRARPIGATLEPLLAADGEQRACRTMVGLLALAHERDCEANSPSVSTPTSTPADCPTWTACGRHFGPIRAACQTSPSTDAAAASTTPSASPGGRAAA